jgi:hypothetical protein
MLAHWNKLTVGHVAPLRHFIQIPTQPVFANQYTTEAVCTLIIIYLSTK